MDHKHAHQVSCKEEPFADLHEEFGSHTKYQTHSLCLCQLGRSCGLRVDEGLSSHDTVADICMTIGQSVCCKRYSGPTSYSIKLKFRLRGPYATNRSTLKKGIHVRYFFEGRIGPGYHTIFYRRLGKFFCVNTPNLIFTGLLTGCHLIVPRRSAKVASANPSSTLS